MHRLVEAGRQDVDEVDVGRELLVLLLRHAAGDEDAEVADALVDAVDDGLAVGADVVDAGVEVGDPAQRLLRRGDVVALGAEADDRRADLAQVDPLPVRGDQPCRGQLVADEQVVDDVLHLLGVEQDVAAPPLLEAEVALGLGVDLRVEVVLLAPERVGGVHALEVLDQPGAVEDAVAEVARERGEPAPAEQPARVAHRVHAAHAGPVGERRAGDDDRAEDLGPGRGGHQDLPAGLAVADHDRPALGLGVQLRHPLEEAGLGAHHVLDRLAGHRVRQEADEVAGVAGPQRHADLAVGLEAADPGPVPGARVDDHEGPLPHVDRDARGRGDPDQPVVDRALELAAVGDEVAGEAQDVRRLLGHVLVVLVAALPHDVEVEHAPLPRVRPVGRGVRPEPRVDVEGRGPVTPRPGRRRFRRPQRPAGTLRDRGMPTLSPHRDTSNLVPCRGRRCRRHLPRPVVLTPAGRAGCPSQAAAMVPRILAPPGPTDRSPSAGVWPRHRRCLPADLGPHPLQVRYADQSRI